MGWMSLRPVLSPRPAPSHTEAWEVGGGICLGVGWGEFSVLELGGLDFLLNEMVASARALGEHRGQRVGGGAGQGRGL